jgi:hypothetical protein
MEGAGSDIEYNSDEGREGGISMLYSHDPFILHSHCHFTVTALIVTISCPPYCVVNCCVTVVTPGRIHDYYNITVLNADYHRAAHRPFSYHLLTLFSKPRLFQNKRLHSNPRICKKNKPKIPILTFSTSFPITFRSLITSHRPPPFTVMDSQDCE